MENHTQQSGQPAPAKKQWQKPDFQLLDNGYVNSGANFLYHESVQIASKVVGVNTQGPASQYHS